MSYRILFVINAILVTVLGLGLFFVPSTVLHQFGAEARVPELLLARFFGAALLTVGLVLWFAKDVVDERTQKNIGLALLIGAVLGLIATAIGVFSAHVIRSNGWIAMLVSALFALGYGFLVFLQPRLQQQ